MIWMRGINMRTKILSILYRALPHVLFAALLVLSLISGFDNEKIPFYIFCVLIELAEIIRRRRWETSGIFSVIFGFLVLWEIYSCYLDASAGFLFPPPDKVIATLWEDIGLLIYSIFSSFWLLLLGFIIAIGLGVSLALICGYVERLQNLVMPIAEIFSAIPALVYAPYAVAVMPSFRIAALFVITSGLFWPILINTIKTINGINKELSDYARTLNLNRYDMIYHILLPYCTPGLFNTLTMQISNAFLLLIGAELMGMTSGVGWYVKYNSDFSNYTKVIVGFIVIGVLVSLVNTGLNAVKSRVLVWTKKNKQNV